MVRALGDPAPGPAPRSHGRSGPVGLMVPPEPRCVASTPSWAFHRFGVERKRADTIRRACSYAARLEETVSSPSVMSSVNVRTRCAPPAARAMVKAPARLMSAWSKRGVLWVLAS